MGCTLERATGGSIEAVGPGRFDVSFGQANIAQMEVGMVTSLRYMLRRVRHSWTRASRRSSDDQEKCTARAVRSLPSVVCVMLCQVIVTLRWSGMREWRF